MRKILVLLLLLFTADAALCSDYVFRDGYYWLAGRAYTRSYYTSWNARYCRYDYVYAYHEVAQPISYKDPGWRSKLLDIAAARDKAESQVRREAFEQAYFAESVRLLGLEGNFRLNGYGAAPPYPAVVPYAAAAVQGSTIYGTSYSSLASIYGDLRPMELYAQATRLAEQSLRNGADATAGHAALVAKEGEYRAKIAAIIANGEAAERLVRAIEAPSAKIETKGYSFRIVPGIDGARIDRAENGVDPAVKASLLKQWQAVAAARCAGCHSGAKAQGGFDVASYPGLSPDDKQKVLRRLTTPDDAKRMPRKADGSVGEPLDADTIKLFMLN